eukprot:1221663-Pyramimonas_sp.AAC.1
MVGQSLQSSRRPTCGHLEAHWSASSVSFPDRDRRCADTFPPRGRRGGPTQPRELDGAGQRSCRQAGPGGRHRPSCVGGRSFSCSVSGAEGTTGTTEAAAGSAVQHPEGA